MTGQKIVNGDLADFNEFSYAVAVVDFDFNYLCGGVLITPSIIVTTASCIEIADGSIGSVLLECNDILNGCTSIPVAEVRSHPRFGFLDNNLQFTGFRAIATTRDIGVLTLEFPSFGIDTAQIPTDVFEANAFESFVVTEVGYGDTFPNTINEDDYYQEVFDGILRKSESTVVSLEACNEQNDRFLEFLSDTVLFDFDGPFAAPQDRFDDTHICTTGEEGGSCLGDQGGPLVVKCESEQDLVIGVYSTAVLGCTFEGVPRVFSRIFEPDNFNFIIEEVNKTDEFDQLSLVSSLGNFCQNSTVETSDSFPTPFPIAFLEDWTCRSDNYGTQDGCHCECGIPDPDCAFLQEGERVINCVGVSQCSAEGFCEDFEKFGVEYIFYFIGFMVLFIGFVASAGFRKTSKKEDKKDDVLEAIPVENNEDVEEK